MNGTSATSGWAAAMRAAWGESRPNWTIRRTGSEGPGDGPGRTEGVEREGVEAFGFDSPRVAAYAQLKAATGPIADRVRAVARTLEGAYALVVLSADDPDVLVPHRRVKREGNRFGADADAKNPFGFRDSVSQPTVAGAGVDPQPGQERAIAPGEFILGEDSETGAPLEIPQPDALGRNGSYVVLRKYDSRPGAFNDFVRGQANDEAAQELLAAKMFGRWRSGAPLILSPTRDDEELGADPARRNDFDFSGDKAGIVCPHGAHMRRLNPRGERLTILTDENIHRIIRRSSTFGPKWSADLTAADDGENDRGIFFIFISARAFDTIEFLQQEWINRGNFIDLGKERDPVVGLHEEPGRFTVPAEPVRRRIDGVTTYNRLRGGEYMFMPSLTALRWIAAGSWN